VPVLSYHSERQGTDQLNAADEQDGSFGAILHRYRVIAGLTQEELAERAGLSVRALRDMERGHTQRPYRQSVQLVADALTLAGQARSQLIRAARAGGADQRGGEGGGAGGAGGSGLANGGGAHGRAGGGHSGFRPAGDSVPAVPAPRLPIPMVPMQLPAAGQRFAGRAAELRDLAALLDQPNDAAGMATIVALTGTAGSARPRWPCTGLPRSATAFLTASCSSTCAASTCPACRRRRRK
jgi:DNA-binding XRE family transcriptional regulator